MASIENCEWHRASWSSLRKTDKICIAAAQGLAMTVGIAAAQSDGDQRISQAMAGEWPTVYHPCESRCFYQAIPFVSIGHFFSACHR
jgi:hypothetical protein